MGKTTAVRKAAWLALMALAAAPPARAIPLPRYGLAVFSNLCGDPEGGDISGERVTLVRRGDGDTLVYEWSEGPLYAAVTMVQIGGDEWDGRLISDEGPADFRAHLSKDGETLVVDPVFKTTTTPSRLRRVHDLSKPIRDCPRR